LFLDRRSVYFACHVVLAAGALVALASLVACLYSLVRHRANRTTAVLGLLLASHAANMAAYLWPLFKHGTNATVFATTFESLFFVIATAAVASGRLRPIWSRRLAAVIGGIALTSGAIITAHDIAPVGWRLSNYAAIGAAVRGFDEALNELSERYAVVDGPAFYRNDHVLYWQLRMSEAFNNTGSGFSGPIDDRYHGDIRRVRHPRYRFWQPYAVTDVADHCYAMSPTLAPNPPGRKWGCFPLHFAFGPRYANVYATAPPAPTGEAWIEPLPADVADPLRAERLATVTLTPYQEMRGRARAQLLDGYPTLGLLGEPHGPWSLRWSLLPLRAGDLGRLGSLETKGLIDHGYAPFLASTTGSTPRYPTTNYLIWLPTSQ
jgi:hypothetical protein